MIVEREIRVEYTLNESFTKFLKSSYTPPVGTEESVTLTIEICSPEIKKYQTNPDKYKYTWNFWVESSRYGYELEGRLRNLVEIRMKRVKEFVKCGKFRLNRMYQFSYDDVAGKTSCFLEKFADQNL